MPMAIPDAIPRVESWPRGAPQSIHALHPGTMKRSNACHTAGTGSKNTPPQKWAIISNTNTPSGRTTPAVQAQNRENPRHSRKLWGSRGTMTTRGRYPASSLPNKFSRCIRPMAASDVRSASSWMCRRRSSFNSAASSPWNPSRWARSARYSSILASACVVHVFITNIFRDHSGFGAFAVFKVKSTPACNPVTPRSISAKYNSISSASARPSAVAR